MIKRYPELFWRVCDLRSLWASHMSIFSHSSDARPSDDPPFLFVVGSGRSGNTLLRRLLIEQLNIYIPPETYVLPKVAEYRIRGKSLPWEDFVNLTVSSFEYHSEFETFGMETLRDFSISAKNWTKERKTVSSLVCGLYCHIANKSGIDSCWIGDKTPLNTLYLGRIDRIIPGAFYIYLLRDGVDVAASYVNAGIYETFEEAADRWVQSNRSWKAFKKKLVDSRYMEVRYEDMVMSPEGTLERIISQFGIPRRELDRPVEPQLGDVAMRAHHENVRNDPNTESIGKGRSILSKDEKKRLRPVFSGWLERCGYRGI